MTIKTWKEEFYPTKPTKKMGTREAILHSLQKWEGLKLHNLFKHSVHKTFGKNIREDVGIGQVSITSETCSLCHVFYQAGEMHWPFGNCEKCPLYKSLGNKECFGHDFEKDKDLPYSIWVETGDPKLMIRALKKTLKDFDAGKLGE